MSSHAARAEDEVRRRKISPLYAAIDSQNWKGVFKLCSKKDIENWDIVLTLKAHALERTGKHDEALALCRQVAARKPTDTSVLSTLALNFKLLDAVEESTACYENALAVMPTDTELAQEVRAALTPSNRATRTRFSDPLELFTVKITAPPPPPPLSLPTASRPFSRTSRRSIFQSSSSWP